MKIKNFLDFVNEKWSKDIKIKSSGEHSDKTIEQIDKEKSNLKKRSKAYQERGEKVPSEIRKKQSELNFAKRAKQGWN